MVMFARAGRPPKMPTGEVATLTLRVPAAVKVQVIEMADALDLSITEYICALVARDRAEGTAAGS